MIMIDTEMPECCNRCFIEKSTEYETWCGLDEGKDLTYNDAMVRRPEWCPLKEEKEETVEPELEGGGSSWWYVCGECHSIVNDRDKYCRQCGKRVLWE